MTPVFLTFALILFEVREMMTYSLLPEIEDTWCYSCIDLNGEQSWCRGSHNLLSSQMAIRDMTVLDRALKEHSVYGIQRCWKSAPYCVILDIYVANDSSKSQYRRGCSDGKDFSFQYLDATYFRLNVTGTRLSQFLPPRTRVPVNRTVCLWSQSHSQACLTACQGDFCNGPQYDYTIDLNTDSSDGMVWGTRGTFFVWVMLLVVMVVVFG